MEVLSTKTLTSLTYPLSSPYKGGRGLGLQESYRPKAMLGGGVLGVPAKVLYFFGEGSLR